MVSRFFRAIKVVSRRGRGPVDICKGLSSIEHIPRPDAILLFVCVGEKGYLLNQGVGMEQVSPPRHYHTILFRKEGTIGVLTLDRPEKLNAMSPEMGREVAELVTHLERDSSLRILVITGAGKAFSAGGDLDLILENSQRRPDENTADMLRFYRAFLGIRQLPVPLIAAINGAAVGAGLCLALACDLRICSQSAQLGLPFVNLNLHPGMGAESFLMGLVGPACTAELLLTGRTFLGEEAKRMGLVNRAVAPADVLSCALELGREIASKGPLAVQQIVQTLRALTDSRLSELLNREASAQALGFATKDVLEGVRAVRERRAPRFCGH